MTRIALLAALLLTWPIAAWAESKLIDTADFTIQLPDGFAATQRDAGVLLVETAMRRTTRQLEIFVADQPPQWDIRQFALRDVAGFDRPFLFTIEALGAGSGGMEYQLVAVGTDTNGQTVMIIAQDQWEIGTPNFAFAWNVLQSYQPK